MTPERIPASLSDANTLTDLALASKASWGYPAEWIDGWREEIEVTPQSLVNDTIYKAIGEQKQLLGFYRLTKENALRLTLSGFWVLKEHMGLGVGKNLFVHMRNAAAQTGAAFVEWESDPNATAFYKHMGAKQVGRKIYFIGDVQRTIPIMQITL